MDELGKLGLTVSLTRRRTTGKTQVLSTHKAVPDKLVKPWAQEGVELVTVTWQLGIDRCAHQCRVGKKASAKRSRWCTEETQS